MKGSAGPVLIVLAVLLVVWYGAAAFLNAPWQARLYERAGLTGVPLTQFVADAWAQDKPVLPAPHQIVSEVWKATVEQDVTSRRSFLYHGWITLSATLLGFAFGTLLGIGLAVLILHNEAMDRSLMPWIIASQTVPILALAPMLVVGLNAVGLTGLVPKALISTYLSFFPIVVGMVKGLSSPDRMQLDLMRTYNASAAQVFFKLRWPAAMPFLFTSMKVGIAISLIGALVGELTNTGGGGLGVRLLTGSYNGQTVVIWAVLLASATLAAALVLSVDMVERLVMRRMGAAGMSAWQTALALAAGLAALGALLAGLAGGTGPITLVAALGALTLIRLRWPMPLAADGALAAAGAAALLWLELGTPPPMPVSGWLLLVATWLFSWLFIERLAVALRRRQAPQALAPLVPLVFGLALLLLWEVVVRGAGVPQVLLPAPSQIGARIAASPATLWADFQQTFLKAVLAGFAMGCGAGFVVAILVDRSPFLRRGLLPIGNFVSALPIIGIAPIMVLWFGFDWPSKAAVIVCITFFPMLVNTVAGLNATGAMERDLMRTYAASYWQSLVKLRLPTAMPFIFNALKINSTLALIGAIVAEFFGTPIVGMGFRIATEVGRLNADMVWAEVAVAAVAGSSFYGLVALAERAVTFWHPSVRRGRA